jgi:hypothetical protein
MPFDDWQFYLVTAIAFACVWFIIRAVRSDVAPSDRCGKCCNPHMNESRGDAPADLTIDGRKPSA